MIGIVPLTNWTQGEVSPRLRGRYDLAMLLNGADRIENMVVLPLGPVTRRPGTRYAAAAKSNSLAAALLPFEFSDEQGVMLEAGAAYLRFFADGGQLAVADVATVITNGTFTAGIAGWTNSSAGGAAIAHDAVNLRLSLVGAAGGTAEARQTIAVANGEKNTEHVLTFQIFGVAGDAVTVQFGTTAGAGDLTTRNCGPGWHSLPVTPGQTSLYLTIKHSVAKTLGIDTIAFLDDAALEIGSPYAAGDVAAIATTQIADVLYLFHPDYPVRSLSRFDTAEWALEDVDFKDGPYLPENTTAITLTAAAATGLGVNLTASAALWDSSDVGRSVRITDGTTTGWVRIVSYTSPTVVVVDIRATVPTTARLAWRLGAWSARTGFPGCGTIDQQRLIAGGATWDPGRGTGSVTGDFTNFRPGADDDDAIEFVVPSRRVNGIRWLASANVTLIGSAGDIARLGNPDGETPLAPTSLPVKKQSAFGAAAIQPVEVGDALLYVQRRGRKLRELVWTYYTNQYVTQDVLRQADHITAAATIEQLAYQQEPHSICFARRSDGMLVGCTYQRDLKVTAWHRHPLGGTAPTNYATPRVVSCATLTGPEGANDDQLYLLVARTINGSEKRTIEILDPFFTDATDIADAFFVDCGLTYDSTPTDALSGLDHLEGETVQVLVDGAAHPDCTVSSGAITLDREGSVIQVGLGFTPWLEPVDLELQTPHGTAQGQLKKVGETVVRFDNTVGALIGRDADHLERILFRKQSDPPGAALQPFTGDKVTGFESDQDRNAKFVVTHDQPLPITVVGVFARVQMGAGS